jgi:hypothetical protein
MKTKDTRLDLYFISRENREKLFRKNKKSFLDPIRLKFPIVNPYTNKIDCELLKNALMRASMWEGKGGSVLLSKSYYSQIKKSVIDLLKIHQCEDR